MADFNSVLSDAFQLPEPDRVRLIDALWNSMPDAELPLHDEWEKELEHRVAAIKSGEMKTIPWETIRTEALARIGHAKSN